MHATACAILSLAPMAVVTIFSWLYSQNIVRADQLLYTRQASISPLSLSIFSPIFVSFDLSSLLIRFPSNSLPFQFALFSVLLHAFLHSLNFLSRHSDIQVRLLSVLLFFIVYLSDFDWSFVTTSLLLP